MEFLYCTPSVFVIGNEYEILINTTKNGLCYVKVGEELFYEDHSGVLASEKNTAKIRVPQSALNSAKGYEVIFRATVNRKAYYSTFEKVQTARFSFKPLEKEKDIRIYHVADVHYAFEMAKKTADYFGKETDLFVVNGDIGEVETVENYLEVCKFVGDISSGEVPVLFVRGNHDTRGKLAERYADYFPANGRDTFFTFELGCLAGVVLDCGEDKVDWNKEYDGTEEDIPNILRSVNRFSQYRQKQLAFLKEQTGKENKIFFAISHICPVMTTYHKNGQFDIERETYTAWNIELERMGVKFMLCGHFHKAFLLPSDDERNILPHSYPVVVGSAKDKENVWGAALTLCKSGMEIAFTDQNQEVKEKHSISF